MPPLSDLLSFDALLIGIGLLVGGGILAYRSFSRQSAELKHRRLVQVQDAIYTAWSAARVVSQQTTWTWDDKVSAVLKKAAEVMASHTGKPLTEAEIAAAKVRIESLEGAELAEAQRPQGPR